MQKTLLFCLIIASTSLLAQPTLTSNKMPSFGTNVVYEEAGNKNIVDLNVRGADVTWNFAAFQIVPDEDEYGLRYMHPSQTPYSSSFPNSNFAYEEYYGNQKAYRYFSLSNDKFERVGSFSNSLNTYSNPQTEKVFPLTLGVSNDDTWNNTNSSTGGSYNLECVGYGTLILPNSVHSDVLMVEVDVEEAFLDFKVFYWYSSNTGITLMSYTQGDGFFIPNTVLFANNISLSSKPVNAEIYLRYNNPVNEMLYLNIKTQKAEQMVCSIFNITGMEIYSERIAVNGQAEISHNINLSYLSSGIYLMNLTNAEGSILKTEKLVKH